MIKQMSRSALRSLSLLLVLMSFQATALAQSEDLVQTLTSQLGISGEQATGGAGALFDYARKNLSADDFASIAKGIPAMDDFLMMAPEPETGSALGKASSMLSDADSSLGGLAGLASSFESLGLNADMVKQFVPIVSDYVGDMSGDQAMQLLQGLF